MSLGSSSSVRGPGAPGSSGTQTGQQQMGIQGSSASGRIKHVGPEPTRYVDFLACQGYVVEILGGKHFKTPEGEFVEMKSGTQYKIHVKNTHACGKNSHMHLHADINCSSIQNPSINGRDYYRKKCMLTYHRILCFNVQVIATRIIIIEALSSMAYGSRQTSIK